MYRYSLKRGGTLLILAALTLIFGHAVKGSVVTLQLPPETAQFKPGRRVEIANAQCLICHSADYVTTQPHSLPRSYWKATVRKMKDKFGAMISEDQIEPLVDYLTQTYGRKKTQ